jgi:hypothetical protein
LITTEQILQFIEDAGDVRVAAALTTFGYWVQRIPDEPIAPAAELVTGTIRLIDAHGFPAVGLRVKVETRPSAATLNIDGDAYHVAQSQTTRLFETDASGVCGISLLPGARVTVHVENGQARSLVVPEVDFDILALPSDDGDAYITPRKPYAPLIRNS